MEITKSNFKELFPLVKDAIDECHFLAIDTELTGLTTRNCENAFDSMDERYQKLREASGKFLIIQYGVSCFRYHPKQKKYTHKDFNFYTFPRPHTRQAPDPSFMCQTSSLHYLASYDFDFNKLLKEGISYLTPFQEEKMKAYLKGKHEEQMESLTPERNGHQKASERRSARIPDDQVEFLENIHKQIEALLSSDTETAIKLPPCNAFRRKLIYQTVEKKYPSGLDLSSSMNEKKESFITVTKENDEEKLGKLQLQQIADMDDLNDAVGFRKVLDLISASNKLVIGHNMLLDVFHTINQFYYPVPENLGEFKEIVRCTFPHLIDTKTLASSLRFKEIFTTTALFPLLKEIKDSKLIGLPPVEAEDGCKGYDLAMEKLHEAGFDAFITGLCYIGLSTQLAGDHSLEFMSPESQFLSSYINRLFIMRHFDISSLNLQGPDPDPGVRENVFYITFPQEWRTSDILDLFSPYGNIYISWLDSTSALVALRSPEQKINVERTLMGNTNSRYKVKSYSDYKEMCMIMYTPPSWDSKNRAPCQSDPSLPSKKRRSSSGMEVSFTNRSIDPIPEEEEDGSNDKDEDPVSTSHASNIPVKRSQASSSDEPKMKKVKITEEDSEVAEVTSTEKLFEEPATW